MADKKHYHVKDHVGDLVLGKLHQFFGIRGSQWTCVKVQGSLSDP